MTSVRCVFTTASLLLFLVTNVAAQDSGSRSTCGDDSSRAELYGARLRTITPVEQPAVDVRWSPDVCKAHYATPDSVTPDETIYLYTLKGAGANRYAVLTYSHRTAREGGEWPASVCFLDEHWKQLGVCVAL